MKRTNYITVMGWMISDLRLKSNDLIIYALIYGFSQDGHSKFTGSLKYIQEWVNCGRTTVIESLARLTEKGYLIKTIEEQKKHFTLVSYRVNLSILQSSTDSVPVSTDSDIGSTDSVPISSTDSVPNNTINNTNYIPNGINFLLKEYPSRFETDFLMQYRKLFKSEKQLKDFYQDFNDEVESQGKPYDQRLFGMLKKYARNWTNFKTKQNSSEADSIIYSPSLQRIN